MPNHLAAGTIFFRLSITSPPASIVSSLPNLMSFFRILLVPVFAVTFLEKVPLWPVVILLLSGVTDLFDGMVPISQLHQLAAHLLQAGTQFRGQFESRVKGLIDEVKFLVRRERI